MPTWMQTLHLYNQVHSPCILAATNETLNDHLCVCIIYTETVHGSNVPTNYVFIGRYIHNPPKRHAMLYADTPLPLAATISKMMIMPIMWLPK